MQRTKKIFLVSAMLIFMAIAFMFVGIKQNKVNAVISSSKSYMTYGTYYYESGTTLAGSPSEFSILMGGNYHSSSPQGTIENNAVLNWEYYYITGNLTQVEDDFNFYLYRNGAQYSSYYCSGSGSGCALFQGTLPEGSYRITCTAEVEMGIFNTKIATYNYYFIVDKTPPVFNFTAGGNSITEGSYTNREIVVRVVEENFEEMVYTAPNALTSTRYSSNTFNILPMLENNGWWEFTATDRAGNTSSVARIYMDTVQPVGALYDSKDNVISESSVINYPFKYIATDEGAISHYQVKRPNGSVWENYNPGTLISSTNGTYTFRTIDMAGNISSESSLYYDVTAPSGTIYADSQSVVSGSYVNAEKIRYTVLDGDSGVVSRFVKLPNQSEYIAYEEETEYTEEGSYSFYSVDRANNTSNTLTVCVDRTKPTVSLYADGMSVDFDVYVNAEYISFGTEDNLSEVTAYVKMPLSSNYVVYSLGTTFTDEGTYSFYAKDKAGNQTQVYTFTLDRQSISAQLYVDDEPIRNNSYTNGAHIKFVCEETCFVKLPDTDEFVEYLSGAEYHKPGKYVFYGTQDGSGTTGLYTIIMDRTIKVVELINVQDEMTDGDVIITWTDGDRNLYAPIKNVKINGKEYIKEQTVYTIDTGYYDILVVDEAGNEWSTSFSSRKKNILTDMLIKKYYESYDKDGIYYSFASYDNALAFAIESENTKVKTGEWNSKVWDKGIAMDYMDSVNAKNGTYYIYKKADNPNVDVVYFTLERLNSVIEQYAKSGVKEYYYWQKEPSMTAEGESLLYFLDSDTIVSNSIIIDDKVKVLVDGELVNGNEIKIAGSHILTIQDDWNNSCDYNIAVIRNVPTIEYSIDGENNNTVEFSRTYYFKYAVSVGIVDELDEMAMFSVYDKEDNLIGHYSIGEKFVADKSGKYKVIAVNHAGESQIFTLVISLNAPQTTFTDNEEERCLTVDIKASVDENTKIQTLEIYKSTDDGNTWKLVETDDYGTIVSLENMSYMFNTTAQYKVVMTDEFRTGFDSVTALYNFEVKPPKVEGIQPPKEEPKPQEPIVEPEPIPEVVEEPSGLSGVAIVGITVASLLVVGVVVVIVLKRKGIM